MKKQPTSKPVERMFPFVLKARILIIGRENLGRSKSKLHFVLVTEDAPERFLAEVKSAFIHYPVVRKYTSADLETFFSIRGAKVIGFAKSDLAASIYAELKPFRVSIPPASTKRLRPSSSANDAPV